MPGRLSVKQAPDHACGNADGHGSVGHVFQDDRVRSDDRSAADADARPDDDVLAEPGSVGDLNRGDARDPLLYDSAALVIEGVLAETGYHSVFENLQEQQALMGLVAGLGFIKRDEARHIAFGVYLLQRLVREEPALWDVIDAKMNALLPKALGVVHESLARFGDNIPYGIDLNELLAFAVSQYTARLNAIQRAVTSSERVPVDAM